MESSALAQSRSQTAIHHKLFSPGQVLLAAVLGSALGGTLLLAENHRRLGKPWQGTVALLIGIGATVILLGLGCAGLLRPGMNGGAVGAAVGCYWYAKAVQGPVVASHLTAGGRRESWWKALALGLAALLGFALVTIATLWFGVVDCVE